MQLLPGRVCRVMDLRGRGGDVSRLKIFLDVLLINMEKSSKPFSRRPSLFVWNRRGGANEAK